MERTRKLTEVLEMLRLAELMFMTEWKEMYNDIPTDMQLIFNEFHNSINNSEDQVKDLIIKHIDEKVSKSVGW